MTKSELPRLLRAARDRFPTTRAMAHAMGITGSRLGRAMKGQDTLNALNCLRLAAVTGESPSTVLRAANKGELAALLEQLYGKSASAIPARERQALAQLQALDTKDREIVQALLGRLVR